MPRHFLGSRQRLVESLEVQREYQRRTKDQKLFGGIAVDMFRRLARRPRRWRLIVVHVFKISRRLNSSGGGGGGVTAVCLAGGDRLESGTVGAGPAVGAGEQLGLGELVEAGVHRALARFGLVARCQAGQMRGNV